MLRAMLILAKAIRAMDPEEEERFEEEWEGLIEEEVKEERESEKAQELDVSKKEVTPRKTRKSKPDMDKFLLMLDPRFKEYLEYSKGKTRNL